MALFLRPNISLSTIPCGLRSGSKLGARLGSISLRKRKSDSHCVVQCVANNIDENTIVRRTGNYQPPIWDFDYVQSLKSDYTGDKYAGIIEEMKEEVRVTFKKIENDPLALLEHIDLLQRLGLCYHFQNEINSVLKGIYESTNRKFFDDKWKRDSLYATALEFRLLRQHGFWIPQDVFKGFKNAETKNYSTATSDDILGLLCLYDASYYCVKGESILEEARELCRKSLEKYVNDEKKEDELSVLARHALDMPLHWKVPRVEARWFIDFYKKRPNNNPSLLKLAILDYNVVQAKYQEDIKDVSRWWTNTRLAQNLEFARDRLVVSFLWSAGMAFQPQHVNSRKVITKVISLVNVVDDVYDVYGTVEELELFTTAVERWDLNEIDHLPEYMKICFAALHNSVNDMAYDVMKEQRLHIVDYLRRSWTGLCKASLQEAKWFYSGYTPTLQEYIENSLISVSAPTVLAHCYFSIANPITKEALASLKAYPSLIRHAAMLLRLPDDLGTASDELARGDNPKSIQCHMKEAGVSEEEAREHVHFLISESWKQLNEDIFANSSFPKPFLELSKNLGRMAQCVYQYGDGHAGQERETKDLVYALLFDPIPLD